MPADYPQFIVVGTGADARVYRIAGTSERTPRWQSGRVASQDGDPYRERRIPLGDGSAGIIGSHRHSGKPTPHGVADVTNGDTSVEDRYGAGPLITTINLATGDTYSAGTIGSSLTIGGGAMTNAAWTVIESQTLGAASSSISFASGLSPYTMFRITAYIVKDGSAGNALVTLNGDTGTNYDEQRLFGSSTTVSAIRNTGQTSFPATYTQIAASEAATLEIAVTKPLAAGAGMLLAQGARLGSGGIDRDSIAGIWNNTSSLISQIDIASSSGNFAAGTVAVLEGA